MPDKCKKRNAERAKKWREANPDYLERYRHTMRTAQLRQYGITNEDYQSLLDKQKGRCAICSTNDLGKFRHFCVDHCHKTGKVRGLLCHTCNRALGLFKDDPSLLRKAGQYLDDNTVGSQELACVGGLCEV